MNEVCKPSLASALPGMSFDIPSLEQLLCQIIKAVRPIGKMLRALP